MRQLAWQWLVLMGLLVLCGQAIAGKAKPGPGGGPGTPPGTIYFDVSGSGTWAMDAAGGNKVLLFPEDPRAGVVPSRALHEGSRWFAVSRPTSEILPDGTNRRELVARNAAGVDVVLWSEAGADVRPEKAWAPDDAAVAFKITRPYAGTANVLRGDVSWDAGLPLLGTTSPLLEGELVTLPSSGLVMPTIEGFDVSPDGTRLVYAERDYAAGGIHLFVKDLATSSTIPLGSGRRPQWSHDGSRIAFGGVVTGVFTILPDGSGLGQVRAYGAQPVWSPDDAWLALTATITTGRGSKQRTADEVVRVPAGGGGDVNLTTDVTPDAGAIAWRW